MLAAVTGKRFMEINCKEVPQPKLSKGEVLIQVEYCGVCGSDLHAYKHVRGYEFVKSPRILGHEVVGTVVQVFDDNNKKLLKKRVIAEAIHFCGDCKNCQSGRTNICDKFQVMGYTLME